MLFRTVLFSSIITFIFLVELTGCTAPKIPATTFSSTSTMTVSPTNFEPSPPPSSALTNWKFPLPPGSKQPRLLTQGEMDMVMKVADTASLAETNNPVSFHKNDIGWSWLGYSSYQEKVYTVDYQTIEDDRIPPEGFPNYYKYYPALSYFTGGYPVYGWIVGVDLESRKVVYFAEIPGIPLKTHS
jgi:hypothetical protein